MVAITDINNKKKNDKIMLIEEENEKKVNWIEILNHVLFLSILCTTFFILPIVFDLFSDCKPVYFFWAYIGFALIIFYGITDYFISSWVINLISLTLIIFCIIFHRNKGVLPC